MLGAFRSADAGPRGAAARIGLAALLACIGLTWTAGAGSAFATYGTVKITKINDGGDPADSFHFNSSPKIKDGGFDLKGGATYSTGKSVHANIGSYSSLGAYTVSEPANNKYELESLVCSATDRYGKPSKTSTTEKSLTDRSVSIRLAAEDTVACTFTNQPKAKIVVQKRTIPADTAAERTKFGFTIDPGPIAYDLADGGSDTRYVTPGKTYTIAEADPHTKGYKLTAISCSNGTSDVAYRTATVTPAAGETVTCSYTNAKLQPGIEIVKSGPATAYAGDTLKFGFDVTNIGERPLTEVDVRDDHCSPVVGPVTKTGGNEDGVLDPGETWHYTCSYVATHTLGDQNPVTNVATARGTDDEGTKVEDADSHSTLLLRPAIGLAKSGPATATAGALLTYTLDVTNPGDMPFAGADVKVTDATCDTAPVLSSTNGDATPGTLNPGDDWTYTCSVQSAVGQTSVVNVADVTGTDENDKAVADEDAFTTTLTQPTQPSTPQPLLPPSTPTSQPPPAQAVAGVRAVSHAARGTAAVQGPRACPRTTSVSASVRGRQIRRVTFLVGGHAVKTVTKARNGGWTLTMRTSSLRRGANAVTARVEFTTASRTKTRTLRISITRCVAQVVQPQFAG